MLAALVHLPRWLELGVFAFVGGSAVVQEVRLAIAEGRRDDG